MPSRTYQPLGSEYLSARDRLLGCILFPVVFSATVTVTLPPGGASRHPRSNDVARARSVVVVVRVVIPDLTDAVSETLPPTAANTGDVDVDANVNAEADTDDLAVLGDPSA